MAAYGETRDQIMLPNTCLSITPHRAEWSCEGGKRNEIMGGEPEQNSDFILGSSDSVMEETKMRS